MILLTQKAYLLGKKAIVGQDFKQVIIMSCIEAQYVSLTT